MPCDCLWMSEPENNRKQLCRPAWGYLDSQQMPQTLPLWPWCSKWSYTTFSFLLWDLKDRKQPQTRKLFHHPLLEILWQVPFLKGLCFSSCLSKRVFKIKCFKRDFKIKLLWISFDSHHHLNLTNTSPFDTHHIFSSTGSLLCLCVLPIHIHWIQDTSNNIEKIVAYILVNTAL